MAWHASPQIFTAIPSATGLDVEDVPVRSYQYQLSSPASPTFRPTA